LLLKSVARQGCPLSPLLFNIVLEFLSRGIQWEKYIQGIQRGKKEIKLSLFADDMILHLKDLKTQPKVFFRPHKHFQQSTRIHNQYTKIHSISIHKYEKFEKEIRKTIPFSIAAKKLKYLGINLKNEGTDLWNENYN
jgi:hypothetical protein